MKGASVIRLEERKDLELAKELYSQSLGVLRYTGLISRKKKIKEAYNFKLNTSLKKNKKIHQRGLGKIGSSLQPKNTKTLGAFSWSCI